MPSPTIGRSPHASPADSSQAVDAFMARLDHPLKADIQTLRAVMLDVDPAVAEGVKWNAPSFRTREYFATVHLRTTTQLRVILHLGAKARALPADGLRIDDPGQRLQWLGPDRAMVEFEDGDALAARAGEFQALLRQWLAFV